METTPRMPEPAESDLRALGEALRGRLIEPGDPDYEAARRVYNGMIDKRPRLIARCADVADVIALRQLRPGHGAAPGGPRRRPQRRRLRHLRRRPGHRPGGP